MRWMVQIHSMKILVDFDHISSISSIYQRWQLHSLQTILIWHFTESRNQLDINNSYFWYQQMELLISTIPIPDIRNSFADIRNLRLWYKFSTSKLIKCKQCMLIGRCLAPQFLIFPVLMALGIGTPCHHPFGQHQVLRYQWMPVSIRYLQQNRHQLFLYRCVSLSEWYDALHGTVISNGVSE